MRRSSRAPAAHFACTPSCASCSLAALTPARWRRIMPAPPRRTRAPGASGRRCSISSGRATRRRTARSCARTRRRRSSRAWSKASAPRWPACAQPTPANRPFSRSSTGSSLKARGADGRPAFAIAAREASARGDDVLAFEARLAWVEADLARGEPVAPARIDELLARATAAGAAGIAKAEVRAGWADAIAGRFAQALARLDTLDAADPALLADVAPLAAYAHIVLGDFEIGERIANGLIEAWSNGDDLMRYSGALVWGARFALLRGDTTAAYELAREAERIARPFGLRPQAAALHGTLAEAALHVGDTALARHEARAALRTADAAWYARDAARTRLLAARILARADALAGDHDAARRAADALDGDDPLVAADRAVYAAMAGAPDAAQQRERARRAIAASTPVDAADAVWLSSASELLDALDGRAAATPLRHGPFEALIARRAEGRGRSFETQLIERFAAPHAARRAMRRRAGRVRDRDADAARGRDPGAARRRADEPRDRAAAGALGAHRRDARGPRHRQARRQLSRARRRAGRRTRSRHPARRGRLALFGSAGNLRRNGGEGAREAPSSQDPGHAHRRRDGRGVRGHRDEPALHAQGVPGSGRFERRARRRARDLLAAVLDPGLRRVHQVRDVHHAGRPRGRGRDPRAARAGVAAAAVRRDDQDQPADADRDHRRLDDDG